MAKVKLTDQKIFEIYNDKRSNKEIAKDYGISVSTVRRIKSLEYKKYAEAVARISDEKNKKENKKIQTSDNLNTSNTEIEFKEINKDQFAGVIFSVLTTYVQPEIAKFIIDNYILSEKLDNLINGLINKINEVKSVDFYKESIVTIVTLLIQKILQPKYVEKLFNENGVSDEKGTKKTENK